jgi:DNA-binding transcriptional regulator YiaG
MRAKTNHQPTEKEIRMPRGIPNSGHRSKGLGPSDNTQRLLDMRRELDERIEAERRKDRARVLLVSFAQKHNLSAVDLRNAAKMLGDRHVGDAPVVSLSMRKSVLRPDKAKPAKGKIGKAIRAARIKAALTDRSLAEHLGLHVSVVNKWQRGGEVAEQHRGPLIEALKLPKGLFPAAQALSNGHAAH